MTQTSTYPSFTAMTEDPRWFGFGYLGARRHAIEEGQIDDVKASDRMVIAFAIERGWTADDLFAWANSKNGRWYGDMIFGTRTDVDDRKFTDAILAGVMKVPS